MKSESARQCQLQDGIYWTAGTRPARQWRLLLMNVRAGATRYEVRAALASVWTMLEKLRDGIIRDLQPVRDTDPAPSELSVASADLRCLLGFGARLFSTQDHVPPVTAPLPQDGGLAQLRALGRAGTHGPYPSLRWGAATDCSIGEADLAIQLTAETDFAVSNALVEVWKLVQDEDLPLDFVTFHAGHAREDQRSWLGFHDCVSNLDPSERRAAIEVGTDDASWMCGGTYMAFLRLPIDLTAWGSLRREHQELLVGRDKLTGCPLVAVERGPYGELRPIPANVHALAPEYIDPSRPADPLLRASHVHRANVNRVGPDHADSNRIFRQGYQFVEPLAGGGVRAGLNFVSFQRGLSCLTNILEAQIWLGEVNFGGPRVLTAGLASISLLTVLAGGYYAIPPKREPFPGADIF